MDNTEITEVTDNDSIAVCNLSSISLPAFVNIEKRSFDYKKLAEIILKFKKNPTKINSAYLSLKRFDFKKNCETYLNIINKFL